MPSLIKAGTYSSNNKPYNLRPTSDGEGTDGESILEIPIVQAGVPADRVEAQIHYIGPALAEMVPLVAAMADGKMTGEEIVEAAAQTSYLQGLKYGPIIGTAIDELRKSYSDGKITGMELLGNFFAVAKSSMGILGR